MEQSVPDLPRLLCEILRNLGRTGKLVLAKPPQVIAATRLANRPGRNRTYDQGIMSLPRGISPAFARYRDAREDPRKQGVLCTFHVERYIGRVAGPWSVYGVLMECWNLAERARRSRKRSGREPHDDVTPRDQRPLRSVGQCWPAHDHRHRPGRSARGRSRRGGCGDKGGLDPAPRCFFGRRAWSTPIGWPL
jgi:hypothetical protein